MELQRNKIVISAFPTSQRETVQRFHFRSKEKYTVIAACIDRFQLKDKDITSYYIATQMKRLFIHN